MVHQSNDLLHLSYNHSNYYRFVFFATICSYNFHWYFTPDQASENARVNWTQQHKALHIILILSGAIGAAITALPLLVHWPWLAGAVFLTFLYTAPKMPFLFSVWLRRIAIGKTIYLSFVWVYVTTVLPVVIGGNNWDTSEILFTIARFFLIYAICIIFDYRDREEDRRQGIRSMITWFSEKKVDRLFYSSIFIYCVATIALFQSGFSFPVIGALLIPALVTTALYPASKNQRSDYFYYFILDGLMMASALITPFF